MNTRKWVVFIAALGMMAATAGYLEDIKDGRRLGAPGVRIGPVPLYGEHGELVATQSVILPEQALGGIGTARPITDAELNTLPKDTTYGRRLYELPDGFQALTTVVVMGTDKTSIHQPQFCLVGAGWTIDKTEDVALPMDRPHRYELPTIKLTTSMRVLNKQNQSTMISGVYVYWFVTADKITADRAERLWSIAATMVEKHELERWAYIAYFATCPPGREEATFERLADLIRASAPDFQVVSGKADGAISPVAARP